MKKIFCTLVGAVIFTNVYATSVVFNTSAVTNKLKMDSFGVVLHLCTPRFCWHAGPSSINDSSTVRKTISTFELPNVAISLRFIGVGRNAVGKPAIITDSECQLHGPYDHDPLVILSASEIGNDLYKITCVQQ